MEMTFFLRTKPVMALVSLADKSRVWYASMLAKEIDCTYSHLVKLLDRMAREGLVSFKREGRVKQVFLTEAGEELAHDFETVVRRLDKKKGEKKAKK